MAVFISYSRKDQAFVDKLSIDLLNHNVKVWRDEYKLSAGDSLTARIGKGIDQASVLCVVLSDSALVSKWVSKEVEAGLLRKQKKSGFTIVPLLVQPVPVPEELRDYLWIDFTQHYKEGIGKLLALLERKDHAGENGGLAEGEDYFNFWGTEQGYVEGRYELLIEVVSFDKEEQFCIVTRVQICGNEAATEDGFRERGIDSPKAYLIHALAENFAENPARVQVRINKPARATFPIMSEDGKLEFTAVAEVKMLGASEGVTTVFNFGGLFKQIKPTAEQRKTAD
ncbi:MAG: toll/interleukin-1 receptor domain-containing protein [Nitrospira sp.]|nr:toll/interleukin-1 receptor domain-containing protein [Nitrospira sp.]